MLWMREAFGRVRRQSAPGVDGVSVDEYAQDLERNLANLLERVKSGRYRAPPVRRGYVPKNDHERRAIGMPTTENKVLERAVAMLLEPIYEAIFVDGSYGFRPKRSAHQALEAIRATLREFGGGYVLDVDVRSYFDSIPHDRLQEILRQRVADGVILRLIGKWLKAGVMEEGKVEYTETGTPQGGVISPLLSNIYLHEVLDVWFEQMVRPRLAGRARLIRYADDFVLIFERLDDAQRVLDVLPKRLGKYGLSIHPEKTRLVDFRHPWTARRKPETFDFLGFTHYWGKTRRGGYAVKKKTMAKRLSRSLQALRAWCKANRHRPLAEQHRRLCATLQGHCAYYGVTGNIRSLYLYRLEMQRIWRHWLNRRSRKRDGMPWTRMRELLKRHYPLPPARIVHRAATTRQGHFAF